MSWLAGIWTVVDPAENPVVTGAGVMAAVSVTFWFVRREIARNETDRRECRTKITALEAALASLREQCADDNARQARELTAALVRIATLESRRET